MRGVSSRATRPEAAMPAALSVPVSVSPEAAARVAELGHGEIFDRMLEQVCRLIPGLVEVVVILVPDYDEDDGGEPGILLMGHVDAGVGIDNPGHERFSEWKLTTYPP